MLNHLFSAAVICAALTSPSVAQERVSLGYGRLVNNDAIGEGRDRWQTGNFASSRVRGPAWTGILPSEPGQLLEYRLNAGIVGPGNTAAEHLIDRPFAQYLSLGVHTHFQRANTEFSVGADLVMTGPQVGLESFHRGLHDALGIDPASDAVIDGQIGNGVHPTFVAEIARDLHLGSHFSLRSFGEMRVGAETLLRAGADLHIGQIGQGELLVRERVTGQRYRTMNQSEPGYSLVLGGDVARVDSSIFLPADQGYAPTQTRDRLRAGVHWQSEKHSAFYGLTYLSEEFEGQKEGQVVGSIRLQLEF